MKAHVNFEITYDGGNKTYTSDYIPDGGSQDTKINKWREGGHNTIFNYNNPDIPENSNTILEEFNDNQVKVVYSFSNAASGVIEYKSGDAGSFEKVITKIFTSIGDVIIRISGITGKDGESVVSIDALVFNEHAPTIVDFFGETQYTNKYAKDVIKVWFDVFKAWAIIIYILILIYIGIKTVLLSGTSGQKKIKGMIEAWIEGLLLLFFLPFLFKYLITINDMLVDIIRTNSKYSVYAYYSFEHLYEKNEDGEDSMTTAIEKLYTAKEELSGEIEKLNEKKQYLEYSIANHKAELDAFNDNLVLGNEEHSIAMKIDSLLETIEGISTMYNLDLYPFGIKTKLEQLVRDFWHKSENQKRYVEMDDLSKLHEDKEFIAEIEKYFNSLEITADDEILEQLKKHINAIAMNLTTQECFDLTVQNINNKLLEKRAEFLRAEQQLQKIQEAISQLESGKLDLMGEMRRAAGETGKFIYVVAWGIILFEVVILLVLYYKRLFMLMMLIIIFPLITIAYVYEKSKGGKSAIFKNWAQEFVANIFIQTIHAILYVTLVETGHAVYTGDNQVWIFYIVAVLALIMSEPLLKNLLGLKGSTLTDLAKTSGSALKVLAAGGAALSTIIHTPKDLANITKESQNKEAEVKNRQEKNDKKIDTLHQHRDNRINKNKKLTESEKQFLLEQKHDKDKERKERRERIRKKNEKRRTRIRRLRKIGRVTKNATALMGTVAGGIAAGGDVEDFITAAGVANALSGTNQNVELSEAAKKLEAMQGNANGAENPEEVAQDAGIDLENINYAGDGYDDYGYGGEGAEGPEEYARPLGEVEQCYAKRLQEHRNQVNRVHVKNNYNFNIENQ